MTSETKIGDTADSKSTVRLLNREETLLVGQRYIFHGNSLKHRLELGCLSNYQSADLVGTPVRSARMKSWLAFHAFWHSGTVVGFAGDSGSETYRVVFVDGTVLESINRTSLRVWSKLQVNKDNVYASNPTGRPVEMPWHKRRLMPVS